MPISNRHFFYYLRSGLFDFTWDTKDRRYITPPIKIGRNSSFDTYCFLLVNIKDTVFYFKLMWQMILTLRFREQLLAPVTDYILNQ